ncbi:MAG: hypothetical protein L6Q54_03625 [Leptospiraceae bacterium]|nr:hypothetical protein [Leptospiraceae bacterium]MCK6380326.1 hypothetical protein [Leptospiraceae bacterium]NUM41759.1 hypothetical protein [Leptospiraceae bacterium]
MPNFTGLFEDIKRNYESLENSLKTITTAYQKTILFFDNFFSWIPPEVILLFIFSVLLLILINNLSPSTPRANLTFSVGLLCLIWVYLNKSITSEYKIFWVFKTSLYVLIPVYCFSIFGFILQYLIKIYKRKQKVSASSLEEYVAKLESAYHSARGAAHQVIAGEVESEELQIRLKNLSTLSENFQSMLKK